MVYIVQGYGFSNVSVAEASTSGGRLADADWQPACSAFRPLAPVAEAPLRTILAADQITEKHRRHSHPEPHQAH